MTTFTTFLLNKLLDLAINTKYHLGIIMIEVTFKNRKFRREIHQNTSS